jgi:formate hydrogenlyase subunit 6/NADH:ubiquinone oxidoreductase subunit I
MKCIGCSACTFVCPTCHCFDITDEVQGGVGRRVRTWDSCAGPNSRFTLRAYPRNSKTERMRQRILHKFSYFKDNQGMISCTGCGRCIEVCPVNMDIREVLAELLRVKA